MNSRTTPPPRPLPACPGPPGAFPDESRIRLARRLAWVSGGFCLVLALMLGVNHWQGLACDPLTSVELAALKSELVKRPLDDGLKKQIRELDLTLRAHHAVQQGRASLGGWFLLGGGIVFLTALKTAVYRKKLPRPEGAAADLDQARRLCWQAQGAVGLLAVLLTAGALYLSRQHPTRLSAALVKETAPAPTATVAAAVPTTPFPTEDEVRRQWPRFRGPEGSGVSGYTNIPVSWNLQTGAGIAWKSPVPLFGPNSPVVWENRVFLTGATAKKREVYCYDAASGKLLWQQPVEIPESPAEPPTVMEETGGFCPSTAATDGRRVYVIFANGEVAALDYQGTRVWARSLGALDNSYGHATSLELYQDRLLLQVDQGSAKDGKSKILAWDTASGKTLWESPARPVPNSWATPIVIHTSPKPQLVTCGNPWVISYDPINGTELWRAKVLYGEITPSPIFSAGLVLTVMEGEKLSAIKPDGSGDVTKSHVVWSAEDGLPDICSPLADGQRVYLLTSHGTLTCYELQSGKKLWEKDLELTFHSSPSLVGDRIWLISIQGILIQVAAGNEFQELSRSEMGEEILASPAFADGRVFLRTRKNLICAGKK